MRIRTLARISQKQSSVQVQQYLFKFVCNSDTHCNSDTQAWDLPRNDTLLKGINVKMFHT